MPRINEPPMRNRGQPSHLPKAEQNVVDSFIAVLSDCEFARYAPTSDPNMAKEKIYQQASDVITQMNASIKK